MKKAPWPGRAAIPLALAALLPLPAIAAAPGGDAPPTLLHLDAVGTVRETPDLLVAVLDGEEMAADPAGAQQRLDQRMRRATTLAGAARGVDSQVAGYAVDHTEPDPKQPARWTARQTLILRSPDAETLLDLVGRLQAQGLAVQSLDWTLSPARLAEARTRATAQALHALRDRADAAAAALGMKPGAFREVSLGETGDTRPRPMPMFRAMAAMDAPQQTRTDTEISETASGVMVLQP